MPWKPSYPGDFPTLGYVVLDFMSEYLAQPDRPRYEPFQPTFEQVQFAVEWYRLDPVTGRRKYRRGVISRPKGWGKSPFLSALAIVESVGPVVPAGWDADGQPVGMPWSEIRTPWIEIAATSEDQTRNAWTPLLEMLRDGPILSAFPGIDPLETAVVLPKGKMLPVTAAATSREGARPCFVVADQTESWLPSNGGVKLAATLRRNLGKTGGTLIEAPNAYIPGEDSVAEATAVYHQNIMEGRARDDGLLYDHREAPSDTDLADRESLLAGLAYAYGDSADVEGGCRVHAPPCQTRGWVDLDRLVAEIWSPDTDEQDSRRFYLGQITHASDSWLDALQLRSIERNDEVVADGETITIGFDGSRGSATGRSKPDATGLVGCRVSDGHLFTIACWEAPDGPGASRWEVPVYEVERAVEDCFKRYRIAGFFADPAKGWRSHVNAWEGKYAKRLVRGREHKVVKASALNPFEWWMTGGRRNEIVRATKRLHDAIVNGEVTYDGSYMLTQHLLNARRRSTPNGIQINKAYPESPRKIDLAVCAVLALEARDRAVAISVRPRRGGRALSL